MLAAAILAAGESSRMGQPKALLPYQGVTFVQHLAEAVRHPRIGVSRIVLGAGAAEIRARLSVAPEEIVINDRWAEGQLSSIHAALRALPTDGSIEGLLLCPVDHPLISAHLVDALIEKFDGSAKSVVLPTFEGRRGHPVIFRASLFAALLEAPPQVGARQVVWDNAHDVLEVPTQEEGVLLNLNDPNTLRRAIGRPEA